MNWIFNFISKFNSLKYIEMHVIDQNLLHYITLRCNKNLWYVKYKNVLLI